MATCPKCGCIVVDGAKFCKNCGSEIIQEEENNNESIKVCPNCGEEIEDGMKFCRNCGSKLTEEKHETKYCPNCGFEMDANINFCPECGTATNANVASRTNQVTTYSHKSPALAAILSFLIIGLGQVYLGLTKKGIILFVLAIISGILFIVFIGYLLWLLVWIYAIYDGYNSANKINDGISVEDTLDFNNLF